MLVKILVLTSSYPARVGTHEGGFIADLARRLPERGILPVVLAPHFPGGQFKEFRNGIRTFRFPYFFPFRFERLAYDDGLLINIRRDFFAFAGIIPFCKMEFLWTLAILFRERPDIIHTHWLIPQGFIGALVHSITGIPHVATVHGSDLNIMKKNRLLRSLCRFIVRNSAAVTVNSTYMKRQLEEVAPEALPKIFVIPMGVDLASFHQRSPVYDRKKAQSEHIILSVGRLISIKGTRFLIEAMPAVVHAVPAARLVIIGTGPEEERLMKRVRELSLDDYVRFLGTIRHDELIPYYQGADVFVLPSITIAGMTEGLGVVLLEAMAAGCPVIGSDVGGIPDIITDGENGFLVPEQNSEILAEKIIQLLSEDNLRDKFRKNGFAKINTMYDWEIITEKFSAVYFEVLKFPRGHDTEFI